MLESIPLRSEWRRERRAKRMLVRVCVRCLWVSSALLTLTATLAPHSLHAKNKEGLALGEHFAPSGDVRLHYTVAGHGPLVIVCSPGWGIGAGYLRHGLAPLEEHFTVLYLDTRGSGGSSRPSDPAKMSAEDMGDDLERLRIFLQLPALDLLGHSDSGSIVLDYAERYSSNARRIIFVDGITIDDEYRPEKDVKEQQEELFKPIANDPRYAKALEASSQTPEMKDDAMARYLGVILPIYFADLSNLPRIMPALTDSKVSAWAWEYHNKANQVYRWNQLGRLKDVKAAALILVGKQDRICPPRVAEHVHAGIAGSQLIEFEGSGHFPWIEQPEPFFHAIEKFLQ